MREHLHHAVDRALRRHSRRRLLQLPPVLHRQAENPGHRWPGRQVRAAVRQEARERQVASTRSPCRGGVAFPARGFRPSTGDQAGKGREVFERLSGLAEENARLEHDLADAARHSAPERAGAPGRRSGELAPLVRAYHEWQQTAADEQTARELAAEDHSFAAEADELAHHRAELERQLAELLAPRDPNDSKDVLLEVKAGEGGEESALFAGDLLRRYLRYAERKGWKTEILDSTITGLGGYKDATVAVKSARRGSPDGVWARLKYEGGVHRVQRVPVTESQ